MRIADDVHLAEAQQLAGVVVVDRTGGPAADNGINHTGHMSHVPPPAAQWELVNASDCHAMPWPRSRLEAEPAGKFFIGIEIFLLPLPVVVVGEQEIKAIGEWP